MNSLFLHIIFLKFCFCIPLIAVWHFIQGMLRPLRDKGLWKNVNTCKIMKKKKKKNKTSFSSFCTNDHPWLRCDETGMTWEWCSNFGDDPSSAFVTGCQSYENNSVVKYAVCKLPVKSESKHKARSKPVGEFESLFRSWATNFSDGQLDFEN